MSLDLDQHDEINTTNPKPSPAEVIRQLAQPGFVDPARAGRGEGVEITMHDGMGLHPDFGVSQMPPDIGVGNTAAVEDKDGAAEDNCQQHGKRECLLPERNFGADYSARNKLLRVGCYRAFQL